MDNIHDNDLTHWGVKGMKWGVRRYQNSDGTLTKAGKKRYDKEMAKVKEELRVVKNKERTKAKIDKLIAAKADIKVRKEALENTKRDKKHSKDDDIEVTNKKSKNKPDVKNMSTQELTDLVNRLNLEDRYIKLTPEKKSFAKRFISKAISDVVVPAVTEVSKNKFKDFLSKKLEK